MIPLYEKCPELGKQIIGFICLREINRGGRMLF